MDSKDSKKSSASISFPGRLWYGIEPSLRQFLFHLFRHALRCYVEYGGKILSIFLRRWYVFVKASNSISETRLGLLSAYHWGLGAQN
jgi:hypothetical protein